VLEEILEFCEEAGLRESSRGLALSKAGAARSPRAGIATLVDIVVTGLGLGM
jgi:hypothetical protein